MNSDEADYYLPAILFFHKAFPSFPLANYPFPGPPLALGIQGLVFTVVQGSIPGLRAGFSTVAALATGWLLLRSRKDDDSPANARLVGAMVILAFPYFFWNTFTLKQHTFSAGLMLGALEMWRVALKEERSGAWIAPSLLLTAAMLTTQLCLPLCAALVISTGWSMIRNERLDMKNILAPIGAAMFPVLVLVGFILMWGGCSLRDGVRNCSRARWPVFILMPRNGCLG